MPGRLSVRAVASLERIVAGGLCTGCGLCASMTPAVTMRRTERGFVRPFADALPARDLARILAVCPGVALDRPVAQAPVHPVGGPGSEGPRGGTGWGSTCRSRWGPEH